MNAALNYSAKNYQQESYPFVPNKIKVPYQKYVDRVKQIEKNPFKVLDAPFL